MLVYAAGGMELPAHTRVPLSTAVGFQAAAGFSGAASFEYVVDDGRTNRTSPATSLNAVMKPHFSYSLASFDVASNIC
jgi:hypothetical protein